MASLVVIILPEYLILHPGTSYEAWDVQMVLSAAQHPGNAHVVGPIRYGYVYITDKDPGDPEMLALIEVRVSGTEVGNDGEPITKGRRRWRSDASKINGPAHKWQSWKPMDDNQSVTATYVQALAFLEDKGLAP